CLAARRQPVTHVEADGQTQSFELTHAALEAGYLQSDACGQIGCPHRLVRAYHLEILSRPRGFGRRVPTGQPGGDQIDVGGRQPIVGGQLRTLVRCKVGHRDHICVLGRPAVEFPLCGLGVRIPRGARLRGRYPVTPRVLGDVVDADRARDGSLSATRHGPRRIPPPQHKCDAAVRNSLGRVAGQQHTCDPTISRWLIAMEPTSSPTTRTESPVPRSGRWKSAWSSRTPRPVTWARWSASSTGGWNSRTGTAEGNRSRSDPAT